MCYYCIFSKFSTLLIIFQGTEAFGEEPWFPVPSLSGSAPVVLNTGLLNFFIDILMCMLIQLMLQELMQAAHFSPKPEYEMEATAETDFGDVGLHGVGWSHV